jgi:Calcineurin-like phosphoesterase
MGFRFSIEHANWLAHILQPVGATPRLEHDSEERETLRAFVETFEHNFFASRPESRRLRDLLREVLHDIRFDRQSPSAALRALREYFRDAPWVALLLPSGNHAESDRLLTDRGLLAELVSIGPEGPGIILQLESGQREEIVLDHVFPAFKVAFADVTRWPGLLVWTPSGDAVFFELSKNVPVVRERLRWLVSRLSGSYGQPDLQSIRTEYGLKILSARPDPSPLRILHLSDLHLGSDLARRRLDRVQTILGSVVNELGEDGPIVPVITGDLMDSPSEENLGDVRSFMSFLLSLGIEKPVVVLGNHDVREDGWLSDKLRHAINISTTPVTWIDDHAVGFACFNSVNGGRLARGWLGEQELTHVGNALDGQPEKASSYTMIGVLHHHPIPVELPSWYKQAWYERLLGTAFEKTEALEDADAFLAWLKTRGVAAVLHGHKHIPRFDMHDGIAIVGCGSTVGKVDTSVKGRTYISLNVITVDRSQSLLGCRLRAERIPGAGLESMASHEMVLKSALAPSGLTATSTRTRRKRRAG